MTDLPLLQSLSAIVLHESAHIFTARVLKVEYSSPTTSPVGIRLAVISKEKSHIKELAVYLSGSIFGIIVGLITDCLCSGRFDYFVFASFAFSILNLLPIKGFDGGEVLSIVVNRLFLPDRANSVIKVLSAITVLALWFMSVSIHMRGSDNIPMLVFTTYLIYSEL